MVGAQLTQYCVKKGGGKKNVAGLRREQRDTPPLTRRKKKNWGMIDLAGLWVFGARGGAGKKNSARKRERRETGEKKIPVLASPRWQALGVKIRNCEGSGGEYRVDLPARVRHKPRGKSFPSLGGEREKKMKSGIAGLECGKRGGWWVGVERREGEGARGGERRVGKRG